MRAIIQRVTKASVTVGDELISSIGKGLCILVGISKDDTPKEREYLVRKILNLRLFDDDNEKRWTKSVKDKQLEILCVSQFTLYSILKGNKPDFHQAMPGDQSQQFYNEFLDMLRKDYDPEKIKDGKFGAYMQVHIQNDGPVTIQLDSPPDSGSSGTQESSSTNKDLLRQARQEQHAHILKRKRTLSNDNEHEVVRSGRKSRRPLRSATAVGVDDVEDHGSSSVESAAGYLACSVCSQGLTHVEGHHLTTTICRECGRGLHGDCAPLHRCDPNADQLDDIDELEDGKTHEIEDPALADLMLQASTRLCGVCHLGGASNLCAGCDQALHEGCRSQHTDCPALLAQPRFPTLSQVLHRKYSKYGHRGKAAQAVVSDSDGVGAGGGSSSSGTSGGTQAKRVYRLERHRTIKNCCVCSNRSTNGMSFRRHSKTVCYYCKKGLHWDCRFMHDCHMLAMDNASTNPLPCDPNTPNTTSTSTSNIIFLTGGVRRRRDCIVCSRRKQGQRHRSRTICKFCKKGLHRKCEHRHMCAWMKNGTAPSELHVGEGPLKSQKALRKRYLKTQLASQSLKDEVIILTRSEDRDIPSAMVDGGGAGAPSLSQQQLILSHLNLRPHAASPTSSSLPPSAPPASAHLTQATVLAQPITQLRKKTSASPMAAGGRQQTPDCRQKLSSEFHVPRENFKAKKLSEFQWITKASETTEKRTPKPANNNKRKSFASASASAEADDGEDFPVLVKCIEHTAHHFKECGECHFFDGLKKMSHLMCNKCGGGVHKKCFYRHECRRSPEDTPNEAVPNMNTGTFVGERPSVTLIDFNEVKDGRKYCDVCSGKGQGDEKRHRSRTQCTVCRKGLHYRCLSQHICPGGEDGADNGEGSECGVVESGQVSVKTESSSDEDVEILEDEESSAITSRANTSLVSPGDSRPSTSKSGYLDLPLTASQRQRDRRQRDSRLLKTGQDKTCVECGVPQKTRMACQICKESVHFACEWLHRCREAAVDGQSPTGVLGERFTGDVVPILASEIKTRKKDCVVCSNRKAGRRSRSSTKCPQCAKGLHRICAPQHICPIPTATRIREEMNIANIPNATMEDDENDEPILIEIKDGRTRYCCVCSTSRKSQITRTACSCCERGLHEECAMLHNCHSMVPRRLQLAHHYANDGEGYGDGTVAGDVEIVQAMAGDYADEEEEVEEIGDGHDVREDVDYDDDGGEVLLQRGTSVFGGGDKRAGRRVRRPSREFETGVESVRVYEEGRNKGGIFKEDEDEEEYGEEGGYLLGTSEDCEIKTDISSDEAPSFTVAGDGVEGMETDVKEIMSEGPDCENQEDSGDSLNEQHPDIKQLSTIDHVNGSELTAIVDDNRTARLTDDESTDQMVLEASGNTADEDQSNPEDDESPKNMEDELPMPQVQTQLEFQAQTEAQNIEAIVAQIKEELGEVAVGSEPIMNRGFVEREVVAVEPGL